LRSLADLGFTTNSIVLEFSSMPRLVMYCFPRGSRTAWKNGNFGAVFKPLKKTSLANFIATLCDMLTGIFMVITVGFLSGSSVGLMKAERNEFTLSL